MVIKGKRELTHEERALLLEFVARDGMDRQSISYPVLWNAFKKIAAPFSEAEQDAVNDTVPRSEFVGVHAILRASEREEVNGGRLVAHVLSSSGANQRHPY